MNLSFWLENFEHVFLATQSSNPSTQRSQDCIYNLVIISAQSLLSSSIQLTTTEFYSMGIALEGLNINRDMSNSLFAGILDAVIEVNAG